jgi:hypothetical protein
MVLVWLFMAEVARQQGRRCGRRDRLLLAGYLLMGMSSSGPLVFRLPEPVFIGTSILTGGTLAAARWAEWKRSLRAAAAGIALAAGLLAMIVLRMQDSARLG